MSASDGLDRRRRRRRRREAPSAEFRFDLADLSRETKLRAVVNERRHSNSSSSD